MNHTPTSHAAQAGIDLDSLEPCPFCGGPARIESSAMWLDLICDHDKTCCLDGDSAELSYQNTPGSRERMTAKWNRRDIAHNAAQAAPAAQAVDALVHAADAVVERWHSRDWKQPHTGEFIARLAAAVGAAKRAASPAPETAQADDVLGPQCWSKEAEMMESWAAHAQQDAAPGNLPTNEELENLWVSTHYGHPADFGADVLERWGGWQPGMLGYGGALNAPSAATGKAAAANAGGQGKETDLSRRLRTIAAAVKPNDPALVTPKFLIDVAEEIERYYGGMLNWKRTAEAKDAAFVATSAADAKDAAAYRFWRDSMLAEDESFVQAVMEALPNGQSDAPPSADEWDAAIAAVMHERPAAIAASQKGGA